MQALSWYQKAQQAAQDNPEYSAKVKALSKTVNRSKQIASKLEASRTKRSQEELAALRFAESKLAYAAELEQEHGSSFPPELHFLNGNSSSSKSESAGEAVRAPHAFDSPEVLTQFIAEMRIRAEDLAATAAVLIAPKSAVAFPQTWRQQSWPFGAHDGIFVQLQALLKQSDSSSTNGKSDQQKGKAADGSSSNILRKTWFIKLRENKPPLEPQEVSQEYELLPQLLKGSGSESTACAGAQ
eukprot:GHUV01036329.1.p1 GENE.GHUV01036329.1~~GHUV01036329.1.p1  ORF type:complete len:241 (+),score=100.73 GHUV01036329.1:90-812(+)